MGTPTMEGNQGEAFHPNQTAGLRASGRDARLGEEVAKVRDDMDIGDAAEHFRRETARSMPGWSLYANLREIR